MKTLTVTEAARSSNELPNEVEREQEEVVLVRNRQKVARLVPEPPEQTALEVLGDLYRKMDDATAEALSAAVKESRRNKGGKLQSMRNPFG